MTHTKIGSTNICLCPPSRERKQYYVAAVGGRMFGSAYFSSAVDAHAYYHKLEEKACEIYRKDTL